MPWYFCKTVGEKRGIFVCQKNYVLIYLFYLRPPPSRCLQRSLSYQTRTGTGNTKLVWAQFVFYQNMLGQQNFKFSDCWLQTTTNKTLCQNYFFYGAVQFGKKSLILSFCFEITFAIVSCVHASYTFWLSATNIYMLDLHLHV